MILWARKKDERSLTVGVIPRRIPVFKENPKTPRKALDFTHWGARKVDHTAILVDEIALGLDFCPL